MLAHLVVVAGALVWVPIPRTQITHLDLSLKANQALDQLFHSKSFEGNHLGSLPQGKQTLGGIPFVIGKKLIQTRSQIIQDKPAKVDGIPVGHRFTELHFLHATSHDVKDGVTIGKYLVHYADKKTASIPLVYGENVRDWWHAPMGKGLTRGSIAWKGTNKAAKDFNKEICLYLTTWKNPHPKKVVVGIDLVSLVGRCGPFCVAITTENK